MKKIYVIVMVYDNKIVDNVFFQSAEEAMEWKKNQLAKDFTNSHTIDKFKVKELSSN